MPTLSLPPLANWQDFERLCCDLWKRVWQVEHAHLNGRQGQPQHGVDVFAPIDGGARWAGVQCKQTDGGFPSKKSIEAEVEKARKFNPGLSDFVIATTAPNDTKAQTWAREINEDQRQLKSFPVTIYGWDDICLELSKHRDLVKHHFPWFSWPKPDLSPSRDDSLDDVRRTYLAHLYATLEPMPMAVFGGGSHRAKTALPEVFVSLDVESGFRLPTETQPRPAGEDGFEGLEPATEPDARCAAEVAALLEAGKIPPLTDQPYSRRFTAVEAVARSARLVLTGPAGSGKSTFGRYLALCLAGESLGSAEANLELLNRDRASAAGVEMAPELRAWPYGAPLPFFIELQKLTRDEAFPGPEQCGGPEHLFNDLAKRLGGDSARPLLARALKERHGAIVILDGLDETPAAETTRERLKRVIETFAAAWPSCRILVTSRPYAYDEPRWKLDDFGTERMAPLDAEKRRTFVHGWYRHLAARGDVEVDQVEERGRDLVEQIEGNSYLQHLAERPLMLTVITDLHASTGGRLPGGRAALFERSVDLLLDRWNQVRHGANIAEKLGMDVEKLRRALETLAYTVHKDRGRADAKEAAPIRSAELWQALSDARPAVGRVDDQEVREYLHQRSGILIGESSTVYRFPHRSYQEFMAACHLTGSRGRFPGLLVEEMQSDPALWREIFLLAVGRMADLPYAAWALVEALLPKGPKGRVADRDRRFELALCAGLALEETGLWQDVEEQDEDKLERIRAWLQRTIEVGALPPVDRAAAGRILGRLGDRRSGIGLDTDGVPAFDWVEIPPGPFLMGDERRQVTLRRGFQIARVPVTNLQFRAFVDDGGYTEAWQRCWTEEGWDRKTKEAILGPDDDLPAAWLLPNHPRVQVSWHEAWAFSQWLGEKLGRPCSLPSEHQWERAARGTGGREYPWSKSSEEPDPMRMNVEETGIGCPCAVGMFPLGASPEGVLDLTGNVWEWTSSVWVDEPAADPDAKEEDLAGAGRAAPGAWRVVRGGGYWCDAGRARSAYRWNWDPRNRLQYQGFRVLLPRPPADARS